MASPPPPSRFQFSAPGEAYSRLSQPCDSEASRLSPAIRNKALIIFSQNSVLKNHVKYFIPLRLFILILGLVALPLVRGDIGNRGAWGDQGDDTFKNPILPGDYSDLDAIRVGKNYYAISSTFQFSPGVVVLHSRDLVNWTILGHVVDDLTRIGPELNWDRMNRYGRGIWAGAIRYHAGKFWVYFGTPDEGFFMSTATNAAGPWTPLHPLWKTNGWDDGCPFWDDDGQDYFVATQFTADPKGVKYNIHLFKMTADGRELLLGSDRIIHQSKGSEANKLYKINGLYYHYYSEVKPEGRVAMMARATNIYGPYESRQLNHVSQLDREPNQGGLVQTPSGGWWFLTHQGTGGFWEGRTVCLLPVTWTNGWPVIGEIGSDGIGNMVWSASKPLNGFPLEVPQSGDDFSSPALAPQWEWNYQPRADKWSLTERPG
jgi:beta-xylosidase